MKQAPTKIFIFKRRLTQKDIRRIKKSLTYHRGVYYYIYIETKMRNNEKNIWNKKFKNKEIIR